MADKELQPPDQRTVDFYGDELTAARTDDGHVYVSVAQMCNALGIDTQAQTRRIRRQKILADGFKGVAILATLAADKRPLCCGPICFRLAVGVPQVGRKRRRAAKTGKNSARGGKVLWEAFQEGRLTADPTFDDLLAGHSLAAQAYRMALSVLRINWTSRASRYGKVHRSNIACPVRPV